MQRAAQRVEKVKKQEEIKPEGSSTITRKWYKDFHLFFNYLKYVKGIKHPSFFNAC